MEKDKEERYADFPVFKGLQKPLEFMGIQGRYIYWAAGTAGGAIVGFILAYCLIGFVVGLIVLVVAISVGAALIFLKQRRGLHTKKNEQGVFIYARSESGKTKCARFEKRNVQKSGKTKRSKNFAHTTL